MASTLPQSIKSEVEKKFEQNLPPEDRAKQVPGADLTLKSKTLCAGMAITEGFAPIKKICQHVCAFHFYSHDLSRQVEAHHYCTHLNEEVRQCIVYDSNDANARLIGVEYIISRRLFEALPEEEKKYWHSHRFEVMSGELYAPRVPVIPENQEMKLLVDTYGKTWHFWQIDRGDKLPFGPPQLMMAFTDDGQVNDQLVADRDSRHGKNTAELRESRAKSVTPPQTTAPGADHWTLGKAWQTAMQLMDVKKH